MTIDATGTDPQLSAALAIEAAKIDGIRLSEEAAATSARALNQTARVGESSIFMGRSVLVTCGCVVEVAAGEVVNREYPEEVAETKSGIDVSGLFIKFDVLEGPFVNLHGLLKKGREVCLVCTPAEAQAPTLLYIPIKNIGDIALGRTD